MMSASASRKVPTRRISFEELLEDAPKHFAADEDLLLSHLAACLSAVFPDGEDFFVRSVRRFRDDVTDPDLKRQVAGFIGQEATHGREHRALNDRLDGLGYHTKEIQLITRFVLKARERVMSAKSNLAATAAYEHYTATLAELLLSREDVRSQFGHEGIKQLFLWHALEESEHKAVAFDVYRTVGGTERMRTVTMDAVTFFFVTGMTLLVLGSLLRDRATYRRGRLRQSWRQFRSSPLMSRDLWRKLRDYNRPDFHPHDRDTSDLVQQWRTELFGDDGTLTRQLVGPEAS